MDKNLKDAIVEAVKKNAVHIVSHFTRNRTTDNNNHSNIKNFQNGVLDYLKNNYNKIIWDTEQTKVGKKFHDSVDILGEKPGRNCIIEIDAVRHDQIAAKFVSRLALWGLDDEPIDYVAILYDSTQKSGPQSAKKYVGYIHDILKKINPNSSLLGIYVNKNKNVEIWDFEEKKYSILGETNDYDDMNKCARAAVKLFLQNNPKITFAGLLKAFPRTGRYPSYIFSEEGGSRARKIDSPTADGKDVYVYSQFRSSNWEQFVEVCKKNGISIE